MTLATTRTHAAELETAISNAGLKTIARTIESDRAADLAIALSPARLAVVRCVKRCTAEDYIAIRTMVADGDFVWGGIVYADGADPKRLGPVESFHVGGRDRRAARLAELREAAA